MALEVWFNDGTRRVIPRAMGTLENHRARTYDVIDLDRRMIERLPVDDVLEIRRCPEPPPEREDVA